MNIMLVAVTERTRKIGVRRAGWRSPKIHLGTVLDGVFDSEPCRWSDRRGRRNYCGWNVPILPTGVVLALGSSLFVGIASGIYPAQRAAQLNLVDALRFE